ncbi:hypothetical protein STEG23_001428 [Scotinomys teguina]
MHKDTCAESENSNQTRSYLDGFGGLTLDVMGHTGRLVHVSGPWTVHDPQAKFRGKPEIKSPLLDLSKGPLLLLLLPLLLLLLLLSYSAG